MTSSLARCVGDGAGVSSASDDDTSPPSMDPTTVGSNGGVDGDGDGDGDDEETGTGTGARAGAGAGEGVDAGVGDAADPAPEIVTAAL